jgi:hypothetical protein
MSFIMKKRFTLSFLLLTFVAQAQVIPVGFIKAMGFTNIPTGDSGLTSNLLLYLDATRTTSYGGTGTTWTDISGQSNNATLAGSSNPLTSPPAFGSGNLMNGSGSFTFAANTNALTSNLISSLSAATFIAWVNPTETQGSYTGIIYSRAAFSGATAPATGMNFYTNNSVGYSWNDDGLTYNWESNRRTPLNQWSMIAVSINSSTATVYLCNASGIVSSTNTVTHSALTGLKFYIGVEPSSPTTRAFKGKIATSMVYSTALIQTNIVDIFNAQKASFGL